MTEREWLNGKDPQPLLLFVRDRGDRKRRLFASACCRRVWRLINDELYRKAVIANEKFADGLEEESIREAYVLATDLKDTDDPPAETPQELAELAVSWAVLLDEECADVVDPDTEDFAILTARFAAKATKHPDKETAAQCRI